MSINREVAALQTSVSGRNDVSRTANGADERRLPCLVYLPAQPANVYVDHVGARVEMETPDMLEDHRARQYLAGMAHEEFKQAILGGLQRQLLAAAVRRMGNKVQFQVSHAQHAARLRLAPAQQHFPPRG